MERTYTAHFLSSDPFSALSSRSDCCDWGPLMGAGEVGHFLAVTPCSVQRFRLWLSLRVP